ncbi:hypothetical protein BD309DRAFT_1003626 [Dichomitus squalens]|nr:hypothetical protein BD309DRAFT_1003626 [Dichomitus squalens]
MSEYWVSHRKYLCKYCNIYIADDAPSRRQHETGLRHKGNVERFVRGLYKAGEKRKQDLEEEKREIARIEKAANAAYAQDVGAGLASGSGSGTSSRAGSSAPAEKQTAAPKPSNPFANYSTAESLGYTDPDAERAKAEAELRRTQGIAGEWEVVEVVPSAAPAEGSHRERGKEQKEGRGEAGESARAGEKRPAAEVPLDDEDSRGWKLRRKTTHVGLGELYDPGAVPIKLKAKKEELAAAGTSTSSAGLTGAGSGGSEKPRWSARGWSKPGESASTADTQENADGETKTEEGEPLEKLEQEPLSHGEPAVEVKAEVKTEDVKAESIDSAAPSSAPAGGSLFKKRKVPVGGGSRGGRRI